MSQLLTMPAPHKRSRWYVLLAQSLGLASLLLAMNYGDLLGGGEDVRMHVPFRLVGIALAQLADIALLGLVIFAALALLRRTRSWPLVRLLLVILLPPYILFRLQLLLPAAVQNGILPVLDVLWLAVVLVLYLRLKVWYRRLVQLGDGFGLFLFVFALLSAVQLLVVTLWRPGPHLLTAAWQRTPQPPRHHARIVWIVFDELSYDQTFEHRAHDLALPAFDALRAQSTLFTNVQPAGLKTVKVIPSLLTGHEVTDYRFGFHNQLSVHQQGTPGFHSLSGSGTIFADAQHLGYRTAVVGWYNPYCTLYGSALDSCYFMNLDRIDGLMSQHDPFWLNTFSPLQQMVREIKAPARADRDVCTYDVRQRLRTHLDLQAHAAQLLQQDQADFIFLHVSVPHSPNIWSRMKGQYITFCDSSYLDNLALADHLLGQYLATLQASPRWQDTTLIVEGDHSWRTFLWDWLPAWTDEDDAASHGDFDPRPALLIHQPGQTTPATVSQPWPLLRVHTVLEDALHHTSPPY